MIRDPFFKKCPAIGNALTLRPMLTELKTKSIPQSPKSKARNQRKSMKFIVTYKGRKPGTIACM